MPAETTTITDGDLVKLLCSCLAAVIGLIAVLVGIMHRQMVSRLDNIDRDLKPVGIQQAEQAVEIKNLKDEIIPDIRATLNDHGRRIQKLELS